MLQLNQRLSGRYLVQQVLGQGGMSVVYLASDERLRGRKVALKEINLSQFSSADTQWAIVAFRREAQLLAKLQHSAIVPVNDYFEEAGLHYLVMDYVEGQTLEAAWRRVGRFEERQVLLWAGQLADALHFLHNQPTPVIFRDLKPANVMLRPDHSLMLIDFGIARFFKAGQGHDTRNMGTAGYAAPEQYGRGQSDARSDVYSLGVVLHQLLTGYDPTHSPFKLPPIEQLNPACSPHVAAAVAQALQLNPEHRFQSVAAFLQALEWHNPIDRKQLFIRWMILALLLLTGMATGLWLWGKWGRSVELTLVGNVPAGLPTLPDTATATMTPSPTASATRPPAGPIPSPVSSETPALTSTPTPVLTNYAATAIREAAIRQGLGLYRPVDPLVLADYVPGRIVVDGQVGDWSALPYAITAIVYGSENWTGVADLSGRMGVAWNDQYLLVAVSVQDDIFAQDNADRNLYLGDSLEFWLDSDLAGDFTDSNMSDDDYQIGISPGDFGVVPAGIFLWRPLVQEGSLSEPLVVRQIAGGYQFEFGLAWSDLAVTPASGRAYGFTFCLSDNDRPGTREQQTLACLHATRIWGQPTSLGTLVLLDE